MSSEASEASAPSLPVSVILVSAVAITFGILGILMGCYGLFGTVASLAMQGSGAYPPGQEQMQQEVMAATWWMMPIVALFLLLKMGLSAGLLIGGAMTVGGKHPGPGLLRSAFVFGIGFEITYLAWNICANLWNYDTVNAAFQQQMMADPNMDPAIAEMMGGFYGGIILITFGIMGCWGLIKCVIYGIGAGVLSGEAAQDWFLSWDSD